jgi:hypothetical protein
MEPLTFELCLRVRLTFVCESCSKMDDDRVDDEVQHLRNVRLSEAIDVRLI